MRRKTTTGTAKPRKTTTGTARPRARARVAEPQPAAAPAVAADAARCLDAAQRYRMVATTAYYIAERRGFAPGHELEDWLAAEAAVAAALAPTATG